MDNEEYRIIPVIQYEGSEYPPMPIGICPHCGAVVADPELHTKWHGFGKVTFTNSTD